MVRVYAKSPQSYFQDGGANMQSQQQAPQIDPQQLMQLIQMFAQITGNDPQQIAQQLQQMPPEQQMQAIQQMAQTIQQQGPEQQMQAQQAQPGMPPAAAEEMPVGEDAAMAEMSSAEEMAPPMMYGGITGYAKTNKKLLKKAAGGNSGANPTYNTEQEKIKQRVGGAIGNNFVNNMIDKASERFMGRAQQPQTNFSPGGAFENPYLESANAAYKNAMADQRAGKFLFNERMEDVGNRINPYLQIKGKAIGDEYNMFNRPKFVQRDYRPGASIEGMMAQENPMMQGKNGGNINASMAFYKNGGYTTIPIMGMFQNAGQAELEKAQEEQIRKLNTAHQNGMISDTEYMQSMNTLDETYANYGKATTSNQTNQTNQTNEDKTDPGYVDLKWRGNLDKATENLYLKSVTPKYGIWGSNGFLGMRPGAGNMRKATFEFAERGSGSDMGALGAGALGAAAGQSSTNPNISNNGTLLDSSGAESNYSQSDRNTQRDYRRMRREDARTYNRTGEHLYDEFDDSITNQPTVQQTAAVTTPYGVQPTTINPSYFQSLPGAPGGMSYNSSPTNAYIPQQPVMSPAEAAAMISQFQGFANGGAYLPMALDGIETNDPDTAFRIQAKEKSGLASGLAPLGMAAIQTGIGAIDAARANRQREDAYNVALNTQTLPGDMVGNLGSWTNTTGPSVFMQDRQMGMLPGRAGFATPAQQNGYFFGQDGGQPDMSLYQEGGDYWMTEDEVKQFMKMGGKVEYY